MRSVYQPHNCKLVFLSLNIMHLSEKLSNLTGALFISTNSELSLHFRGTIVIYLNNVPQTLETAKSFNKRPSKLKTKQKQPWKHSNLQQ